MSNQSRISELISIQESEVENNFKNGDLWNDCQALIDNIEAYGQEEDPKPIINNSGIEVGYILKDGTEFIFRGMSIYDYFD